ncbi:MAG: hypothetical protein HOP03_18065 [Lysobacter sp.]|nr:hypothetical protein [Lysobacter sp.]
MASLKLLGMRAILAPIRRVRRGLTPALGPVEMYVDSLKIPVELVRLIDGGVWPSDERAANMQNIRPLFAEAAVKNLAPEEFGIFLYPPPFHTVQHELDNSCGLTDEQYALAEIAPTLTVPIGDFGLGSDTAIALDYRNGQEDPAVIRLVWNLPEKPNRWQTVSPSFAEFWNIINSGGA